MNFALGQKWISMTEPELGIGQISRIDGGRVSIYFDESDTTRVYSSVSAPIKRLSFSIGDRLTDKDQNTIVIDSIIDKNGLYIYRDKNREIKEKDISLKVNYNNPIKRLKSGNYDSPRIFNMRYHSQLLKSKIKRSDVYGFVGGKIELFLHQLYISYEVTKRSLQRVLLADEVGLGKTIEACLIVNRLLITEQVKRVLILVPESLIYQWFTELLQKFNLTFRIIDKKYLFSFDNENPFLDGVLSISSFDYLQEYPEKKVDALNGEWDIVIVDEVHNLKEGSDNFVFLKKLLKSVDKAILLTATPQQLGSKSHFERLKLLDPDRYINYEIFTDESKRYLEISKLAKKILNDQKFLVEEESKVSDFLGSRYFDFMRDKKDIIQDLIDRHGIGRVMFRNSRKSVRNFPKRIPYLIEVLDKINFVSDLLSKNRNQKFLLISHLKESVIDIANGLNKRGDFKYSLFHEELKPLERDRNAFWFSLSEGAQILLCSEIGSEGRNFQFVNNLILYDLPDNPELLEQRIGRLDRIGQKKDINIYIPYISRSRDKLLANWYDKALNCFRTNIADGEIIYNLYSEDIKNIETKSENEYQKFIEESQKTHTFNLKMVEDGRDYLLELNSFNEESGHSIINEVKEWENDFEIEEFMHSVFDYFGVNEDIIGDRSYILTPANIKTDAFPKIDEDGILITYKRDKALQNSKIQYISLDHPYVMRSIELIGSGDYGSTSIGFWFSDEKENIFLETIFIAYTVAPKKLHIDKYFPETAIRVMVDINLEDWSDKIDIDILNHNIREDRSMANQILDDREFLSNEINAMFETSKKFAKSRLEEIITRSITDMTIDLSKKRERLIYLKGINPAIKDIEIDTITQNIQKLEQSIKDARVRFDAMRVVWRRKR